jgi:hypothetical protein
MSRKTLGTVLLLSGIFLSQDALGETSRRPIYVGAKRIRALDGRGPIKGAGNFKPPRFTRAVTNVAAKMAGQSAIRRQGITRAMRGSGLMTHQLYQLDRAGAKVQIKGARLVTSRKPRTVRGKKVHRVYGAVLNVDVVTPWDGPRRAPRLTKVWLHARRMSDRRTQPPRFSKSPIVAIWGRAEQPI